MMMTSHGFRSKQRNSAVRFALPATLVLVAVVLVLLRVPVPRFLGDLAAAIASPVWAVEQQIVDSAHGIVGSMTGAYDLALQNATLRNEIRALQRASVSTTLLEADNERLRGLLGRPTEHPVITATVFTTESSPLYDVFAIDAGRSSGVSEGDLVTTEENSAIGWVTRAHADSALVELFTAAGVETPVLLGATTTLRAIAQGQGGGFMKVTLPRDLDVKVGDMLTLQSFVPYPLGVVDVIEGEPTASFQTVLMRSMVSLGHIRYVLVHTGVEWRTNDTLRPVHATSTGT